MWKRAFPEYAVKQAFHEINLERGDEHVITAMQSDLLTRCLFSILKGAMIHCIHKKRKYINEVDIAVGKSLCIFPFRDPPKNSGALIDPNEFVDLVQEHIELCASHIKKYTELEVDKEYKISHETLTKLQSDIESSIRGFVYKLSIQSNGNVNFRQFEILMSNILGDPSYMHMDHNYVPVN